MTDSTGDNEVAPEDPTDAEGGEVPNASPPSADDHVAGPEGGSDAPLPPPTGVDHTVELKAAGVKTPDISDVFTPPDGDEIPDPPTPPRPPERPQRPGNEAEAKASSDSEILPPPSIGDAGEPNTSEGFDPNKTSAIPAGGFDASKTSAIPAGGFDASKTSVFPAGGVDPDKTSVFPAGGFDPGKTSVFPAGGVDPDKTSVFPAGGAPAAETPPPPPPTDPPPPPPGPSDPIPQDPTGPSAVHAPLGQADPTLDEPAGDIASYRPEPEADKGQDKTEDDPNATVVVNPDPTEGDPNTTAVVNPDPTEGDPNTTAVVNPDPTEDDPNATVVVSPSPTEDDPNATVVMPGDSNLTGDDPNATVSMSSGSAAPDPDRDQPPHPNAAGPQPSTDATSVLTVVTTTEIPPAPSDPVPAEATQLATPPAPAGTPTEVVSATPEEPSTAEDEPPSVDATPSPGADGGGGDETDKSKGRRRRPLRILILTIVALIVLIYAAWLLDLARASGEVVRGTKLGSTSIAGLDAEGLAGLADELDAELAATGVELSVGDTIVNSNPVTLGAGIDREALSEVALAARRDSNPITGPLNWLSTFFSQETIEPIYLIDESVTSLAVDTIVATELDQPVEPELLLGDEGFTVTPGRDGVQLEASEVVDELMNVLDQAGPFALTLTPITAQPELETAEVEAVASEVNEVTAGGVVFRILDQTAEVDAADLRQWVELNTSGSAPPWSINTEEVIDDLQPMFPALGSEDQQARFSIVDGEPIIIPASETVVCCTPTSVSEIRRQLLEPLPEAPADEDSEEPTEEEPAAPLRIISLEPETVGSDEGVTELESLGIIEEVSSFTTMHACCQNRVANIHRFADLMTGAIIRPGEELSLNDFVGRRTVENGFVADGAIVNGVLDKQVGGGVSQFATTFFNAAFYAGIDFNEYQSHSLYISRYPKGREATISFPRPDLSVTNTTDYGILVWPTYTSTSITVTFYSTKHIEVEDLPLLRGSRGHCSVFTTPRVRTYPDGTEVEDSVFALYRPGEGLDCNGNSTVPEDP